jgi:hypothetical protein
LALFFAFFLALRRFKLFDHMSIILSRTNAVHRPRKVSRQFSRIEKEIPVGASRAAHPSFFAQPIADANNVFLTCPREFFVGLRRVGSATKGPCDGER